MMKTTTSTDNPIKSVDDLIASKEAARRLNLTHGSLKVKRCQKVGPGRIPSVRLGRGIFYRESDIAAYIARQFGEDERSRARESEHPTARKRPDSR